jgi:hypothetical protein
MARALNGMATNTATAANLSTLKASKLGPIRQQRKLHEIAAKFFYLAATPRRMLQLGHVACAASSEKAADFPPRTCSDAMTWSAARFH